MNRYIKELSDKTLKRTASDWKADLAILAGLILLALILEHHNAI